MRIADEGEEIDKVLRSGPGEVVRDGQPSSSSGQRQQAAAGEAAQAPSPAPLQDQGGGDGGAMAVDQGPEGGERTGVREMALGSLTTKADYGALTRSISLDETAELMLDEKVEEMRVLLQIGGVSVRDAYQCKEPVLAEIFSPPRLTRYAQQRDGLALDLTVMDEYGQPWDFSKADCRQRANEKIADLSPDLLLGCTPCRMYSPLQFLNRNKGDPVQKQQDVEEAQQHLDFCAGQYEAQMMRRKFFVHEHPANATSWESPSMVRIAGRPDVYTVVGEMCEQGLKIRDEHGEAFAKKTTGYLTNSECIAKELGRQPMSSLECGPTNEEVDLDLSLVVDDRTLEEDWLTFTDESSGKPLSTEGVRAARAEEIDFTTRYEVWTPVPISECYQETGTGPIGSRWIDLSKGDEARPNYRSRLVIQEVHSAHIEAIFAATPPLESVRMLLSLQLRIVRGGGRRLCSLTSDGRIGQHAFTGRFTCASQRKQACRKEFVAS